MSDLLTEKTSDDQPVDIRRYLCPDITREDFIRQGQSYLSDLYLWLEPNNLRLRGSQTILRFSRAHDQLITMALAHASLHWEKETGQTPPRVALVALGGYGRRALYLRSDVDLLLLMKDPSPEHERFIKMLLHLLIDLKLDLGYSTRTVQDCLNRLGVDIESVTAMVESRFVAGSRSLYNTYHKALSQAIQQKQRKWFLRAVFQQWHARLQKYQSTVYLLEPNVKEAAGGLRDVQTVRWILFALGGSTDFKLLKTFADFNDDDLKTYRQAIDMLQTVRNELHIAAGSKTDQLNFAYQPTIAKRLGYESDAMRSAEEVFMGDYYRAARNIARYSRRAFNTMTRKSHSALGDLVGSLRRQRINKYLLAQNSVVYVDPQFPNYLEEDPRRIMEVFEKAEKGNYHLSEKTLDRIGRISPSLGVGFRLDAANARHFKNILKGPWSVGRTLRDMHECGVLDKFMPEFARLNCMVRIDHYHHYTVDTHTLKAIEMAEELRREPENQRSFAGQIAHEIERWDLLNLALLLHDIGKGFGRGHALRGGQIAQRIGERLGLPPKDIETVRFLVLSHLKLSHASQRRDLSDPQVARQLADEIGTIERLKMLYVHSVCDLKAVSPEAWNDWKDHLLRECYSSTAGMLDASLLAKSRSQANLKNFSKAVLDVIEKMEPSLRAKGANNQDLEDELKNFLTHVSNRYLSVSSIDAIARHFLMRRTLDDENALAWRLDHVDSTQFSELSVCAVDVPGLFSSICGALAAKGINIWSAQIFSTTDGLAINKFQVTDLENNPLPGGLRLDRLRQDLNAVLLGQNDIDSLIEKHRVRLRKRHLAHSPHPSRVIFDNESSQAFTVIELRSTDRHGLLFQITRALGECRLNIHRALITTEAYGIVDVFYVTDLEYNKIHDRNHQKQIEKTVLAALES